MSTPHSIPHYRHTGAALLRSAVVPITDAPVWWPDPTDPADCQSWLQQLWRRSEFTDAIWQANPALAGRVEAIQAGEVTQTKVIRRVTMALARYVLRAVGRPTPFGLFAGVSPAAVGRTAKVRWGDGHREVVRVDAEWVAGVIDFAESIPSVLERLDVVFSDLVVRRGARLELRRGPDRTIIRCTRAVQVVRDYTGSPIRFGALADRLTDVFRGTDRATVSGMLTELVRQGFLITCLRAPLTVTDPLAHVIRRLHDVGADAVTSSALSADSLESIAAAVSIHNNQDPRDGRLRVSRESMSVHMGEVAAGGRNRLAVDLLLDCDMQVPDVVVGEVERAAGALLRLTRHPAGNPIWRDFYSAFFDRYGMGTLVPVTDVVDPDSGLGFPSGYPGSVRPPVDDFPSDRDLRLLALAWQTATQGAGEIAITDETIRGLVGDRPFGEPGIPPHVEVAIRVNASSAEAMDRGEYTIVVAPARAGGTLTSRFTATMTGSGLEEVYRGLPVTTESALPVQLSFPPAYPHAENICRVPAYLPYVLPLGEHRDVAGTEEVVSISDLAITATSDRLYLVSLARRRVVEPQVFHALALDKQAPPLARFLAHIHRGFLPSWTAFDWGPHADRLPYLPRVRYGRAVLSPARWRLTTEDLPSGPIGPQWLQALDEWKRRCRCPNAVELRDGDRALPMSLETPIHAAILHAHLQRHGHAILTGSEVDSADLGWCEGHAHEIALPLVSTRPASPSPPLGSLPVLDNHSHGQPPGSASSEWLYARLYTHPERLDELMAEHLSTLNAALGDQARLWFIRYRDPHDADHLRLRIRTADPTRRTTIMSAVSDWVHCLRHQGLVGRLVFDTYYPEVGRYGHGPTMTAAEDVFVADSCVVSAQLRDLPATIIHPTVLMVVNMVDIARGFLGNDAAMCWLMNHPTSPSTVDRVVAEDAIRLAHSILPDIPHCPRAVAEAWHVRFEALATYRELLSPDMSADAVLESLLHMHHNRAFGIDPNHENSCRRLARNAALARRARNTRRTP